MGFNADRVIQFQCAIRQVQIVATEIANHAAGIVVGKLGTATCSRVELEASFRNDLASVS